MSPIFHLRIHQKQYHWVSVVLLHVPFSDVVGESSNLGTLVRKKDKLSTALNLVEHASSQHDNPSPLCSLYKNDSLDTYVPFVFHIFFDVELRFDE